MSKAVKHPSKSKEPDDQGGRALILPNRSIPPDETARLIAEFTAELTYLAHGAQLDLLAYLLDMARLEAVRTAQSLRDGD